MFAIKCGEATHHWAKPSSFAEGKHHSKNAPLSVDKSAFFDGGEGEIRTLEPFYRLHDFQLFVSWQKTLDKAENCRYNDFRGTPYGGGCSPYSGMQILFASPRGEVMLMYVTWELLFLFAGFIISLLAYIDIHNKKN